DIHRSHAERRSSGVHPGAEGRSPSLDSVRPMVCPLDKEVGMGNRRRGLLVLATVAVLALVAAACGSDDNGGGTGGTGGASGSTAQNLSGTITISGSSTVQPITSLVAELFNEDVSSDVSITVDGPGTGDGFVLFCDGETDIQDASRTI